MAFTIKNSSIDIGETPIENIFINNFMLMADEVQLKVYIMGLSMTGNSDENQNNYDIAKILNIKPSQVKEAWMFWKELGIVDFKLPKSEEDYDFDIKFLSIREEYINSNFIQKTSKEKNQRNTLLYDEEMKKLFDDSEDIMNKPLSPDDRIKIIEWLTEFNINKEMFIKALKITYVERPPDKPSLKYARGILSKWSQNNIKSLKEAKEYEENYIKKAEFYREVNYRLLSKTSIPTEAQIKIIDALMDKTGDKDLLLKIVDICSESSVHSTYSRLRDLAKRIEKNHALTESGIDEYLKDKEAGGTSKFKTKKASQNFKQKTYQTMSKEDAIKTMKKNNPALLYNANKEQSKNE